MAKTKNTLEESVELHYCLLILNVINIFFHSTGGWVLYKMYRRSYQHKVEQMLILNLSAVECLTNLFEIVRIIPDMVSTGNNSYDTLKELVNIMMMITFTGLYTILYATMIYITLDRLLNIRLSIKYKIIVTENRCKRVLILTWLFTLCLCVAEVTFYYCMKNEFSWEDVLFMYVYPPIQLLFLVLAITTYCFIFHAYKQAKLRRPGTLPGRVIHRQSSFQLFKKSRFFVYLLLVVTFVIFMIIPDVTYVFMAKVYDIHSDVLVTSCMICYAASNLSDAFIYILAEKNVRTRWLKMRWLCCCRDCVDRKGTIHPAPQNEFVRVPLDACNAAAILQQNHRLTFVSEIST